MTDPILHDADDEPFPGEEPRLLAWRQEQLLGLGVSRGNASAYAGRVDWHDVAVLVQRGCPPDTALDIAR
jgi:hypothetical protein